jgi:hypothetical protein
MLWLCIASFLFNQAMAGISVSRRRYGWATAYALAAIWAVGAYVVFALEAVR